MPPPSQFLGRTRAQSLLKQASAVHACELRVVDIQISGDYTPRQIG